MTQVATRVPAELVEAVDRLVEDGVLASRSEAVRIALSEFVDRHRRDGVGRAIAAGYQQTPQTPHDGLWSDDATVAMIREEPW